MRLMKETLAKDNGLVVMVGSGAKGKAFNVAQIVSYVGQQFEESKRLPPSLAYQDPTDPATLLEIRGFVANSFMSGLTPEEFLHHAKAARTGVVDTSRNTATSGDTQRKLIKTGEGAVTISGVVRDVQGKVFAFVYGDDGLAPSKLFRIKVQEHAFLSPINIALEAARISYANRQLEMSHFTDAEVNEILDEVGRRMERIPAGTREVSEMAWQSIRGRLRVQLKDRSARMIKTLAAFKRLIDCIICTIDRAHIEDGAMPGSTAGPATSANLTQAVLRSFHHAGNSQNVADGVAHVRSLLTLTKPKYQSCTIHFRDHTLTVTDVLKLDKELVSPTLKELMLSAASPDIQKGILPSDAVWMAIVAQMDTDKWGRAYHGCYLRIQLDTNKLYDHQISMARIVVCIESSIDSVYAFVSPASEGMIYVCVANDSGKMIKYAEETKSTFEDAVLIYFECMVFPVLDKVSFKGIRGISAMFPVQVPVWNMVSTQSPVEGQPRRWNFFLNRWCMMSTGLQVKSLARLLEMVGIRILEQSSPVDLVVEMPAECAPDLMPGKYIIDLIGKDREYVDSIQNSGDFQVVSTPLLNAAQYTYAETNGSNLSAILSHPLIDGYRSCSNDIMETFHKFGIEAARALFIIMIKRSFRGRGAVHRPAPHRHDRQLHVQHGPAAPLQLPRHVRPASQPAADAQLSATGQRHHRCLRVRNGRVGRASLSGHNRRPPSLPRHRHHRHRPGSRHGKGDPTDDRGPRKGARHRRRSHGPARREHRQPQPPCLCLPCPPNHRSPSAADSQTESRKPSSRHPRNPRESHR